MTFPDLNEDMGLSSRYLFSVLSGATNAEVHFPWDPDDFGRCERLLRRQPQLRDRMGELAHPVWKSLAEHWAEIVETIEAEVPNVFESRHACGSAPRGYELMRRLIDEAGAAERAP